MLAALVVALRSLALICGGHRAVALENLALRQQLAVFKRTVRRPQLCHRDRLFWMLARERVAGLAHSPRWLLRDRDAICGEAFRQRVASMRSREVLSTPSSPWQNRMRRG
jgi:hypothetical protein